MFGGMPFCIVQCDLLSHLGLWPNAATGTGWTFSPCTVDAFISTLGQALETYREHPDSFRDLQSRGMIRDSSWDKAAQEYEQIFDWAKVDQPYCR